MHVNEFTCIRERSHTSGHAHIIDTNTLLLGTLDLDFFYAPEHCSFNALHPPGLHRKDLLRLSLNR